MSMTPRFKAPHSSYVFLGGFQEFDLYGYRHWVIIVDGEHLPANYLFHLEISSPETIESCKTCLPNGIDKMTPRYAVLWCYPMNYRNVFLGKFQEFDLYYRNGMPGDIMVTNGSYLPAIYSFDDVFMQQGILHPAFIEAVKRAYQSGLIR